jgi:hypothetical protein
MLATLYQEAKGKKRLTWERAKKPARPVKDSAVKVGPFLCVGGYLRFRHIAKCILGYRIVPLLLG